jgi:hypothetical protein
MLGVPPSRFTTSAIATPCTAEMLFAVHAGFRAHCSNRSRVSRGSLKLALAPVGVGFVSAELPPESGPL